MNVRMLRHVRGLWNSDLVPVAINRANRRKWIRSVRMLGGKWLLAKQIERQQNAN